MPYTDTHITNTHANTHACNQDILVRLVRMAPVHDAIICWCAAMPAAGAVPCSSKIRQCNALDCDHNGHGQNKQR